MKPIRTRRTNLIYKGDGADIMDLPCERAEIVGGSPDGGGVVYSVWEFEEEEREHIATGGNLKVGILFVEPIPPVSLQIVDEKEVGKE